jgi:hypothetical protein
MAKEKGFLQLRRGLWEHVRDGSLTHIGALIYIYMLSQADTRTGIWKGSAQALSGELGIPKSTVKYALRGLDGLYIKRFVVRGKRVCYPILLHKFFITQGQYVGLRLDALGSTSGTSLAFMPADDSQQVVQPVVQQVVQPIAPQRRIEIVDGKEETKPKATARYALPDWVPLESWNDFLEMRKGLRAVPTEKAKALLVGKLKILKDSGEDPKAVLEQSVERSWKGVFPVRDQIRGGRHAANQTALSTLESQPSGPDKSRRDDLLRTWLVKFSANHQAQGREPAVTADTLQVFMSLWAEGLADIPTDALEMALRATLQTCKFFPTVADIRAQLDQAKEKGLELEAECAWQHLLKHINEYCGYPRLGENQRPAPQLAPAVEYAARAAGGIPFIERCSEDQLVWCHKDFLAAYKIVHETGKVEHLLGCGETKDIVRRLTSGPPVLPPINSDWEKKYALPESPQEVAKLAVVKDLPEPYHVPTQEEWDRRKQQQKAAVEEWVRTHPEHAPKSHSSEAAP